MTSLCGPLISEESDADAGADDDDGKGPGDIVLLVFLSNFWDDVLHLYSVM